MSSIRSGERLKRGVSVPVCGQPVLLFVQLAWRVGGWLYIQLAAALIDRLPGDCVKVRPHVETALSGLGDPVTR